MEIITILAKSPIFKGVESTELQSIFEKIHYRVLQFEKENTVAYKGDQCRELRIMLEGSVRAEMTHLEKMVKVEDLRVPMALAPGFIFGKDTRYPVTVTANTDCKILCIDRDGFSKLLMTNQTILINYLDVISSRTQTLARRLNLLTRRTIRQKIAQYLLDLSETESTTFKLPMTQAKLADYFAVARPPLTRALTDLQREGIISLNTKVVEILDKDALADILEH